MKCIRTRHHGPTARKGARVSACDADGNRLVLSVESLPPHPEDGHVAAAQALSDRLGWTGRRVVGWFGRDAYHVFTE